MIAKDYIGADGFRYQIKRGVVMGQVRRDGARMAPVDDPAIEAEVRAALEAPRAEGEVRS